jgi:hypothetical protein
MSQQSFVQSAQIGLIPSRSGSALSKRAGRGKSRAETIVQVFGVCLALISAAFAVYMISHNAGANLRPDYLQGFAPAQGVKTRAAEPTKVAPGRLMWKSGSAAFAYEPRGAKAP